MPKLGLARVSSGAHQARGIFNFIRAAMLLQRSNSKWRRKLPWWTNVVMGGEQLLDRNFMVLSILLFLYLHEN